MRTRWMLVVAASPAIVLASEHCITEFGGKCRAACAAQEKAEQGAFIDCADDERCCVPLPAPKGSTAAAPAVVIDQMAFSPQVVKVRPGTEVVWKNADSSLHTVTATDGSFGSPPLAEGATFRKVFAKPGTYSYACEMHPFMTGTIVVEEK